jgi:SpoVK/Ycf46/Vps4 family AAA+-type ATPase
LKQVVRDPAAVQQLSNENAPTAMKRLEDEFVGLDSMKTELKAAIAMAQYREARKRTGKPLKSTTMHLVLEGSPGTGKTETARIYGEALHESGVLPGRDGKPVFVETSPNEIKGSYLGQTASRMREMFKQAEGGVLFIDEANAWLNPDDQYGMEAMDTLMKLAEDNRDKVVVVLAGYPGLRDGLGDVNPGLPSRFPSSVSFPDLDAKDKVDVGLVMFQRDNFTVDPKARKAYSAIIQNMPGQGRDIRNFNELVVRSIARRMQGAEPGQMRDFDLHKVTLDDVKFAAANYRDEFGDPITNVGGAVSEEKPKKMPNFVLTHTRKHPELVNRPKEEVASMSDEELSRLVASTLPSAKK